MKTEERRRLLKQEKMNKIKFHSAVVIQMTLRGKLACKIASHLRESLVRKLKMKAMMATKLSCWWRCCLARSYVTELRLIRREELKRRLTLEIWAATKICAAWRGHLGRVKAKYAREVKASRWTKEWDEGHGRFFYYDQVSCLNHDAKIQAYLSRFIIIDLSNFRSQEEVNGVNLKSCWTLWQGQFVIIAHCMRGKSNVSNAWSIFVSLATMKSILEGKEGYINFGPCMISTGKE
jgi:hypothetical protein